MFLEQQISILEINYSLTYIHNTVILNSNNTSQYYCIFGEQKRLMSSSVYNDKAIQV